MTKRFGVSIPDELLAKLDKLAKKKGYSNRSEVLRDLIRDRFVDEEWESGNAEVVGTVTLVYNHHAHDLSDKLADLQHSHFKNIISTTHIHRRAQLPRSASGTRKKPEGQRNLRPIDLNQRRQTRKISDDRKGIRPVTLKHRFPYYFINPCLSNFNIKERLEVICFGLGPIHLGVKHIGIGSYS